MKDHIRDNILNIITSSTRKKINQLTLFHFKFMTKTGEKFLTLMDIFTKEDDSLNYNRLKFRLYPKRNSLEFLIDKNLITSNYQMTTLGIVVILSHKLGISIFSVFILSTLYNTQMTIRKDMFIPYPMLEQWFESFLSVTHIRINIADMTQKGILDNNLQYRLAGINLDKLDELRKYDKYLKAINQYVDDVSIKIDNLISNDSLVISHRNKNLKLLAGMNFA